MRIIMEDFNKKRVNQQGGDQGVGGTEALAR